MPIWLANTSPEDWSVSAVHAVELRVTGDDLSHLIHSARSGHEQLR